MCAGMVTNVFFNECMNMGTGREENVIQCHMVMGFQKVIFNSVVFDSPIYVGYLHRKISGIFSLKPKLTFKHLLLPHIL